MCIILHVAYVLNFLLVFKMIDSDTYCRQFSLYYLICIYWSHVEWNRDINLSNLESRNYSTHLEGTYLIVWRLFFMTTQFNMWTPLKFLVVITFWSSIYYKKKLLLKVRNYKYVNAKLYVGRKLPIY